MRGRRPLGWLGSFPAFWRLSRMLALTYRLRYCFCSATIVYAVCHRHFRSYDVIAPLIFLRHVLQCYDVCVRQSETTRVEQSRRVTSGHVGSRRVTHDAAVSDDAGASGESSDADADWTAAAAAHRRRLSGTSLLKLTE